MTLSSDLLLESPQKQSNGQNILLWENTVHSTLFLLYDMKFLGLFVKTQSESLEKSLSKNGKSLPRCGSKEKQFMMTWHDIA